MNAMTDAQIIDELWNEMKDDTFMDEEGNENKLHELMGPDQFYAMATGKMKAWYSPLIEAGELFFKTPIEDIKDLTGRLLQVVGWISPEQVHRYEKLMEVQHKVLLSEDVNDNLQKIVAKTADLLGETGAQIANILTPGGALKVLFSVATFGEWADSMLYVYNDIERKGWNNAWDNISGLAFAYYAVKKGEKAAKIMKEMTPAQKIKVLGLSSLWAAVLKSSPDIYKAFAGTEDPKDTFVSLLSNLGFILIVIVVAVWRYGGFKPPPYTKPEVPSTPKEPTEKTIEGEGGEWIDRIPNMARICSNCGIPLPDQPALEGINGLLCFPCRYNFDKEGGQSYVLKKKEYERERDLWERMYSKQWDQFHEKKSLAERYNLTAWGLTIGAFFSLVFFQSLELVIVLFIGAGVIWLYYQDARTAAEKLRCDPPPEPPKPDRNALSSNPRLIFDPSCCPRVGSPDYDIFVGGYPPDWDVRREFVLKRDSHWCRLCGSTKPLQVHHVWPVSYSSNHTPQNLITLCRKCHKAQKYYNHEDLWRKAMRLARRR